MTGLKKYVIKTSDTEGGLMPDMDENKEYLDESRFMRGQLHTEQSSLQKYAALVIGELSFLGLLKYEFITGVFGFIPGALGLVLRKIMYPKLFSRVGRGVVFGRNVTVRCGHNIVIGDGVVIDDYVVLDGRGAIGKKIEIGNNVVLNRGCVVQSKLGDLVIGNHSTVGAGSAVISQGGVEIGSWVGIAGGCEVSGGLFEPAEQGDDGAAPFRRYTKGPVIIGDNTIMAYGAIIIDGVVVGKKCMIGPGCVVMANMPDDTVASMRPAMILPRKK